MRAIPVSFLAICLAATAAPTNVRSDEVTLKGSLLCNGATLTNPKAEDHTPVLFAIEGTPEVQAEVDRIMADWPDKGLDAASSAAVLERFSARLKFFIDPDSPALKDRREKRPKHYCDPAEPVAVTGTIREQDGRKWIAASRIAPAKLKYPDRMLAADKPFAGQDREPIVLKATDKVSLKCVWIPPGKFLMGTPYYTWPYFVEEFPHEVTLTRGYYLAEVPVTQELYEAVMGANPSTLVDPQVPAQDPPFADVDRFCQLLSDKTGRKVRLPSDAEWEYAARVGTSNPGFSEKYKDQYSGGNAGWKKVLPVKSKQPNPWGLYDLVSCWWEITGDRGVYNVRKSETDPRYPPQRGPRVQRQGRGVTQPHWSIVTHEFITEKGYTSNKFRVLVEAEEATAAPGK